MAHRAKYEIEVNGVKIRVPSVTTVTGLYTPAALLRWFGKFGNEECDRIKKESANFGSLVHDGISLFLGNGKMPVLDEKAYPDGWVKRALEHIERVAKWVDQSGFFPEAEEFEVESREDLYHGTADVRGYFKTDPATKWVLDWKTSNGLDLKMRLQIAAYAKAWNEMNGLSWDTGVRNGGIIRLSKDPQAEVQFEVATFNFLEKDYPVFRALRHLYDYIYRKGAYADIPKVGYEEKEK